jgi:predicted KAP-like P-loop ATPase
MNNMNNNGPVDPNRRDFLKKALGASVIGGVAVASGLSANGFIRLFKNYEEEKNVLDKINKDKDGNESIEFKKELANNLLNEMKEKGYKSIPVVEITSNENLLSSGSWAVVAYVYKVINKKSHNTNSKLYANDIEIFLKNN